MAHQDCRNVLDIVSRGGNLFGERIVRSVVLAGRHIVHLSSGPYVSTGNGGRQEIKEGSTHGAPLFFHVIVAAGLEQNQPCLRMFDENSN